MKKNIKSIWDMALSQCVKIDDNARVFEIKIIRGITIDDMIGIYYEDTLLGYIYPRNKATFAIEFNKAGMIFRTYVKYNKVTGFGEKTPTDRIGHKSSERLAKQ